MIEKAIRKFYSDFNNQDGAAMIKLYHKDVHFEDPAFGPLQGEHACNMWLMLCQNAKGLKVSVDNIKVDGDYATATWKAEYLFSQTGRKVINIIDAKFHFEDGKIIEHQDDFNLHTWAKQALGTKGYLLGWSRFFQRKMWEKSHYLLAKFENKNK